MVTIAVALGKGGVGRTTTAVNLAHSLERANGARVLLVDTDSQGHCATALGVQPTGGLAEVLRGASPQSVMVHARHKISLLAGGPALAEVRREIDQRAVGGDQVLAEVLAPLKCGYDAIILDTGPRWDSLTVNALFAADAVLCPVSMEPLAVQALSDFQDSLEVVRRSHERLRIRYIVPTFVDGRVAKSREIIGRLRSTYGPLVTDPIRYDVRLSECAGLGKTIFEYDPDGRGAQDYLLLEHRVVEYVRSRK